jgi:hypothetical protein
MKTESISETRNVRIANVITLKSSAVRRPNLSPMTPPSRPPIIIPAGPHASAERSCALAAGGGMSGNHCGAIYGMAFGRIWLSTPSRNDRERACRRSGASDTRSTPSSMAAPTSTVFMPILSR